MLTDGGRAVTLRALILAIACLILPASVTAQTPAYRSLTTAFADFAEATAELPMPDRIAAFRTRITPLFPSFYRPRDGRSVADLDRMIARSLEGFSSRRLDYEAVAKAFGPAYLVEVARFRRAFPDFRLTAPVYLLHSLGEMDAGTRFVGGKRVVIFAADGIAQADSPDALPMLIDHEFFHLLHGRSFPGCYATWCTLWREGLAVYAASVMNPGASDQQLGLDHEGLPLGKAVEQDRRTALCLLQSKLGLADRKTTRLFFQSGGGTEALPPRFGYYLGYRIAQRAGQTHSLTMMTRLPPRGARALIVTTLSAMANEAGGCAASVVAQP